MHLQVGSGNMIRCRFTQDDFDRVARLSGDDNPIHTDPRFCSTTRFKKTVAHGALLWGMISKVMGKLIPGAIQCEQESIHPFPCFAGEELIIWVGVSALRPETNQADLDTLIIKPDGSLGLKGKLVVNLPVR